MEPVVSQHVPASTRLSELAVLYLKLGTLAFGGPAAHIAMMEDEVVRRRGWMDHQAFLDLLGVANLLPGPSSTELAIFIGWRRAGLAGLLVAGTCFILPAAVLVTAIAWAYVRFGRLPAVAGVMYGVKPVVIAVVAQALWRLGRTALKTKTLAGVGVVAAVASGLGMNPLPVLIGTGFAVVLLHMVRYRRPDLPAAVAALFPMATGGGAATIGLWPLFLVFLKLGSVVFGSGYVLLAFLRSDLVERFHWMSEGQLIDAVAVGQVTPGPVFTTATFIGYLLAGPRGAVVATIAIFLPAFVLVAASAPLVPRIRRSPIAGAFLDGLNVAALALMAVVTCQLARAALVDGVTLLFALAATGLLIGVRLNAAWLVVAGGVIGLLCKSPMR
jgi:chromate transporter